MVTEHCAGIVIYRNESDGRRYLLLHHRDGGHWSLPKGHIEPGESPENAALRETREETGIADIEIIPGFRTVSRYQFTRGDTPVDKDVIYFLGRTTQQDVRISPEHTAWQWADYRTALATLTYDDTKQVLHHVERFFAETATA